MVVQTGLGKHCFGLNEGMDGMGGMERIEVEGD
jgi:hypothetical protein